MCVAQGTEPARISVHAIFNQNTHVFTKSLFYLLQNHAYMCRMVGVAMVASQQWTIGHRSALLYSYMTDVSNCTVIQIHAL